MGYGMEKMHMGHTALRIRWQTLLLLLLAIGFTCFGAYRGEADTVLAKAIRLCLECVGIG